MLPSSLARLCFEYARPFDVSGRLVSQIQYSPRVCLLLEHPTKGAMLYYWMKNLLCCPQHDELYLLEAEFGPFQVESWVRLLTHFEQRGLGTLRWHTIFPVLDIDAGVALDTLDVYYRSNGWKSGPPRTFGFTWNSCILNSHYFVLPAGRSLLVCSLKTDTGIYLRGHTKEPISTIAASKNDNNILVGCEDGSIHLWLDWKLCLEVNDERCLSASTHCQNNPRHIILRQVHTKEIQFASILPSYFLTAAADGIWLWKKRTPWIFFDIRTSVDAAFETRDGQVLIQRRDTATLLNPHSDECSISTVFNQVRKLAQMADGYIVMNQIDTFNELCTVHA